MRRVTTAGLRNFLTPCGWSEPLMWSRATPAFFQPCCLANGDFPLRNLWKQPMIGLGKSQIPSACIPQSWFSNLATPTIPWIPLIIPVLSKTNRNEVAGFDAGLKLRKDDVVFDIFGRHSFFISFDIIPQMEDGFRWSILFAPEPQPAFPETAAALAPMNQNGGKFLT